MPDRPRTALDREAEGLVEDHHVGVLVEDQRPDEFGVVLRGRRCAGAPRAGRGAAAARARSCRLQPVVGLGALASTRSSPLRTMLCTRVKGSSGKRAVRNRSIRMPASSTSTVRVCTPERGSRRRRPAARAGSGPGRASPGAAPRDSAAAGPLCRVAWRAARRTGALPEPGRTRRPGRCGGGTRAAHGSRAPASSPRLRAARSAASRALVRGPVPARPKAADRPPENLPAGGFRPFGPPRLGGRVVMICRGPSPFETARPAVQAAASRTVRIEGGCPAVAPPARSGKGAGAKRSTRSAIQGPQPAPGRGDHRAAITARRLGRARSTGS